MKSPAIPPDEAERHAALCALEVLDTRAEARFDRFTRIAQSHFQVPIALVSMVDTNRQWFKSRQGLDAIETPRNVSFCGHAILSEGIFHIPDAHADPRFADNPLVTGTPHVRFYAGAPLHAPGGERVGTLCIIDSNPRTLSAEDFTVLRDLADGVEAELERTHLLRAQAELRSNEQRLQYLIRLSPGGIYSFKAVADFDATYVSAQAESIMGYKPVSFIEDPSFWLDRVHPDDRERVLDEMKPLFETGEQTHEYRFLHADGGYRWIHDKRHLVRDAQGHPEEIIGLWMDVTGRKAREAELRELSLRLSMALESAQMGAWDWDVERNVLAWDDRMYALFGVTPEAFESPRAAWAAGVHPEDRAHFDEAIKAALRGEKARELEFRICRPDGAIRWMKSSAKVLRNANGKAVRMVGTYHDISGQKEIERMKSEFVSTVSHELRTPLTSIRGALSLLAGKHGAALTEKGRQLLDMAKRNSERLTLLINDILDLEKIESGSLEFEFKALDLAALAQQALAANEGYAHQHDVRLRLAEVPHGALIQGDEHRLLQVFANLLSNAIKYSPKEGEVVVSVARRDARHRVSVQDYGRGIPHEFRSRMFQRFAQADSSDTREKGGTGLGLSVTKAIVERHGGTLDFASELGAGTEFFFDLPVWNDTVTAAPGAQGCPLLLICEDNSDVAHVLGDLLAREGLSSDIAATAARAKSLLGHKRYQAMVLDLGLPDQDGLALIRELRAAESTRDLPIVVVSGRASEGKAAWHGDALAVADWLQKPVDEAQLAQAVRRALAGRAQPRILHVEDDLDVIQVTGTLVDGMAKYFYATTLAEARRRLAHERFDLVLLDLVLPDGSGLDLMEEFKDRIPVIIFSGQEQGGSLGAKVAAALVKTKTSNEQLLATIRQTIQGKRSTGDE